MVVWEAAAEEVVSDDSVEEESLVEAAALEESDALVVMVESVAVESVAVELLSVTEAVEAVAVVVPSAPVMPKLGEKFMLEESESSMISMVYWKLFTAAGSTVKVAVPSEAGMEAGEVISDCSKVEKGDTHKPE